MQARNVVASLLALAHLAAAAWPAWADDPSGQSPRVSAFERFARAATQAEVVQAADDELDDDFAALQGHVPQEPLSEIEAGRLLLTELNCVACHASPGLSGKPAPRLDDLLARVRPSFVRSFLANPRSVKPGTTMPHAVSALPPDQQGGAVEALTHYLASLGSASEPEQEFPLLGAGESGRRLFRQVGCGACHDAIETDAPRLSTSAPLGGVADKYSLPSLAKFLTDPLHVRAGGRMPDLGLSLDDARDLAAYLLQLPETARLRYQYYEGRWEQLPDFNSIKPQAVGFAEDIDVQLRQRDDRFGLRFEGLMRIAEAGRYRFTLGSDDGSRLSLDGEVLLDLDGIHAFLEDSVEKDLQAGSYRVRVDYFEMAGEEGVQCQIEGPGLTRRSIAQLMRAAGDDPAPSPSEAFETDPTLVAQGRTLYRKMGCAACHEVQESQQRVTPSVEYQPLSKLRLDQGCLSDEPNPFSARFAFDDQQRDCMRAALAAISSQETQESTVAVMLSSNCYACHRRGSRGGVEPERDAFFATSIPEMGDEGRLPPSLDGVGFKLTDTALARVITHGANDRPYMLARMPRFGEANVRGLAERLVREDARPPTPAPRYDESLEAMGEFGRQLVGEHGLACIKCHTFGRFPASGLQSIDLQTMAERLRPEWLRLYLLDPQVFRPRTRMPTAWPAQGKSLIPDVLDGDCDAQIAAVAAYLSAGARARVPSGLELPGMELAPIDDAIIYRNFVEGAGASGIAVGYPESVHLAFDPSQLRLALLWQGRFLDAKQHWTARGAGFVGPAGDNVVMLPQGSAWAVLEDLDMPWPNPSPPERAGRFRGYRLAPDQRPTFLYDVQGHHVEDWFDTRVHKDATSTLLRRTLRITRLANGGSPPGRLVLRAATGDVQPADDGWHVIDGRLRIRSLHHQPVVRESGSTIELLIPIGDSSSTSLELEYQW